METTLCDPCKARQEEKIAYQWCITCEEPLCSECTATHKVMKVSRNHQLSDISKIPIRMNLSDQFCSKHDTFPFEYFCFSHDEFGCKECLANIHRTCKNVMSIDMAAKNVKKSQSFTDSMQLIQQLLESIKSLNEDRHQRVKDIEEDVIKVKESINDAKRELISHIDNLERALLQELLQKKDEIISNLDKTINQIQNMTAPIKEKAEIFDFVEEHGTDKQAFLLIHSSRTFLKENEQRITSITEKATDVNVYFKKTKVRDILQIGLVDIKETSCQIKFVPMKDSQSQVPVDTISKMPILVYESDLRLAIRGVIFGLALNDRNEVILCDNVEKRLLIDSEINASKYEIKTKNKPWDVAAIPDTNIVAVTFGNDDYIQFIDTSIKKDIRKIQLEKIELGGIDVSSEHLFVGAKGKIYVLDHQGCSVRSIQLQNTERTVWFLCLGKNGNIFYTLQGEGSVNCLQSNGKAVFSLSFNEEPWGIQTDINNNVYVVCRDSTIKRYRPDGTVIDVLRMDKIKDPLSLCFNGDYTKLYISNRNGLSVSRFGVV